MESLITKAAVKRLIKTNGRVPTTEYLRTLDDHVRDLVVGHCDARSMGQRLNRKGFLSVPAGRGR